jgi:mRNA interferase MazF
MTSTAPERLTPRRGEIWLAALGKGRPGEPGKHRPVVVVSADAPDGYAAQDLIPVVPLSSSRAPSESRPSVPAREGLVNDSLAMVRAVRGIAASRLLHRLAQLEPGELAELDYALAMSLNLLKD